MNTTVKSKAENEAIISIVADHDQLANVKSHVLLKFSKQVKVPGFRQGKAPSELVEKNVEPSMLQSEFLEHAINDLYPQAIAEADVRPIANPEIEIKKFVPFSVLEFEVKVPIIGDIKLPDYKKISKERTAVKISEKDIDEVINALLLRSAKKVEVKRPAKLGDEVWIDFSGVNEKGVSVKGADGKDYPLNLGSNTFIPGFEDNLVEMSAGDDKTFTLTFPKDYGVSALAGRKVTFSVTVKKVNEVVIPKLDDDFASSVGPVKTVDELKADIKKELQIERQRQSDLEFESELVRDITAKTKFTVPKFLVDEQIERMWSEMKQNLAYRGQTAAEFLEAEAKSEEEYKNKVLYPKAEERVKASFVLAEIAEAEELSITPEELEIRLQALKSQYSDPKMQEELDKTEVRQEIASRMLSEKTVATLANYITKV